MTTLNPIALIATPQRPQIIEPPADFQPHQVIGAICGEPVYGDSSWDRVGGTASRYSASVTLFDIEIIAYPSDPSDPHDAGDVVNFRVGHGPGFSKGDVRWSEWGRLRELAQMANDPIGQLMALARAWCAHAEQRRAA